MLSFILASLALPASISATTGKRGIVGVDNIHTFADQKTLLAGNAPTWAYNYGTQPGNATWFGNLEFVPQLWGGDDATTFEQEVLANVPATKRIFAFNEPDAGGEGQATMTPALAATIWKRYVEPLRAHGIELGSPSCTGTDSGIVWLQEFYGNCTTCNIDFVTTHWYGDYIGLAAHLGQLYSLFNGTPIWITELGIVNASIPESMSMYNESITWLDGLSWVDRYAWFGDFRSQDSNIGPNVTMLDTNGALTDLGRSYLYQNGSTNFTITQTTLASSSYAQAAAAATTTAIQSGSHKTQHTGLLAIAGFFISTFLITFV